MRFSSSKIPNRWIIVTALAVTVLGVALQQGGGFEASGPGPVADDLRMYDGSPPSVRRFRGGPSQARNEPQGVFVAQPGDRFVYDVRARSATSVADSPPAAASSTVRWAPGGALPGRIRTSMRAALEVVVLTKNDRYYDLAIATIDPRVTVRIDGQLQDGERRDVAAAGYVRLERNGRILGYSFSPTAGAQARQLLVSMFSQSHQFVVTESESARTEEGLRDEFGLFDAEFARAGGDTGTVSLRRRMLRYDSSSRQRVLRSDAIAHFRDGWISRVHAEEGRESSMRGIVSARTTTHFDVALRERTFEVIGPDLRLPSRWGFDFVVTKRRRSATPFAKPWREDETPERALARQLARLADLVAADGLSGREGYEVWRDLSALVWHAPAQVLDRMQALVLSGDLPVEATNWIVSAVGHAGGEGSIAATTVLADLISNQVAPEGTRFAALLSAHQLGAHATPAITRAATDILIGAEQLGAESRLPSTAALLLGTLADNPSLPARDRQLIEAGLDLTRETAFEQGEPQVYFEALANSRRPELLEVALEFIDHDDESVRQASVEALRRLAGNEVARDALLGKAISVEPAPIRLAALDALRTHEASDASIAALRSIALQDIEPRIRSEAVGTLGRYARSGSASAKEALADVVADAPDATALLAYERLEEIEASTGERA